MSIIEDHLKRMNEINAKASANALGVASQMPKIVERFLPDQLQVKHLLEGEETKDQTQVKQ
jgi:hypothetical protein